MNRLDAAEWLPLVQALACDKNIEWDDGNGAWLVVHSIDSAYPTSRYRIMPEQLECWARVADNGDMVDYYTGNHPLSKCGNWVKMRQVLKDD